MTTPAGTAETLQYRAQPGRFDEAVDAVGQWRPAWSKLVDSLASTTPESFADTQRHADRLLDAEGAGHLVHDLTLEGRVRAGSPAPQDSRPWRVDPLPFVIDRAEFDAIAAGAIQRMRVLERCFADIYGPQRLVRDRAIPANILYSWRSFRPTAGGPGAVGRWLVHYALDVVRDAAGEWRVVQDLCEAPAGLGYTLLTRAAMARLLPDALRLAHVAPIHEQAGALRRALTACAPRERRSPRCVVLTSGPGHSSYVEHSFLATQLGYHLAEGADLVMRQGRLWLRAIDGLEPIDVVYRRIDDGALDPLEGRTFGASGVPGIVWGARRGGVTLANAYGTGLAQEPGFEALLGQVSQVVLGESLQLQLLGAGTPLATVPVFTAERGQPFSSAAVVLRLQLAAGPEGITVMPGAAGRVLAEGDDPARPTMQRAKDVWVVGGAPTATRLPLRLPTPPQVDFGTSVPKRAADALFWLGRAAERGEVAARAVREVGTQLDRDQALTALGDEGWSDGVSALLRAAQGAPKASTAGDEADDLVAELRATSRVVIDKLATLVQQATSVREFMSGMTGRVLLRLARTRSEMADSLAARNEASVDQLDLVLVDLAALAGLAMESTVRGPAWRFLDLGRRVERALAVLGSVEATLGLNVEPLTFQPLAEIALAANESLVAYRRRYRSDIDLEAVIDLLIRDDTNPRSLAYQLDRLREHAVGLGWAEGLSLIDQASIGALTPIDTTAANGRRLSVDALVLATRAPMLLLTKSVATRWFADPVNPTVMGSI